MAKRLKRTSGSVLSAEEPLLVATNRANLLAMCAAGMIWPADAYRKHYRDVSDLAPGAVPVFRRRIPEEVLALVEPEGDWFDVAIDLEPRHVSLGPRLALGEASVGFTGDPIPWAAVRRIYVRSAEGAEDLAAREFEDIPVDAWMAEVRPDVWSSNTGDTTAWVEAFAAAAGEARKPANARDVDRFLGGFCMMRNLAPPSFAGELTLAALASAKPTKGSIPKDAPAVPTWGAHLVASLLGHQVGAGDDVDQRLLDATITCLAGSDSESGFVPGELIEEVRKAAADTASEDQRRDISQWADYADRSLSGENTPTFDDSGSVVRRGLLLFILRRSPDRVAAAGSSNLRPGPAVQTVAGAVAGYAATYSRLDRGFKGDADTHRAMSLLGAARAETLSGKVRSRALTVQFTLGPTEGEPPGVARSALRIGEFRLSDRRLEPTEAMKTLYEQARNEGVDLTFDAFRSRLVTSVELFSGRMREVSIESVALSRQRAPAIRFTATCDMPGARSARTLGKPELLSLLERNAELDLRCRLAISSDGRLQVVAHHVADKLDISELRAYLGVVARIADEESRRGPAVGRSREVRASS